MILIDTHVWVWWNAKQEQRLSRAAIDARLSAEMIGVSAISCWEVGNLIERDRLRLNMSASQWIHLALRPSKVCSLPTTASIAVAAGTFTEPQIHRDPADRLIVATALHHDISLVTKDREIIACGLVPTIW